MLLPATFEDETLYSLVARIALLNQLSPSNPIFTHSKQETPKAADIVMSPHMLQSITQGRYGDFESVMNHFRSKLITCLHQADYNLIGLTNKNRHIWKWCAECAQEELCNFGVNYWHISLQQPFTFACDKHITPLRKINLPYRHRQNRFLLPLNFDIASSKPACKTSEVGIALQLSNIESEICVNSFKGDCDLLKHLFNLSHSSIDQSLDSKFAERLLLKSSYASMSFLRSLLEVRNPDINWLPALILLEFGSFKSFISHYEWLEVFKFPSTPLIIKKSHRDICLDFLLKHPEATRTEVWKAIPNTTRWLSKYDRTWINQKFPRIKHPKHYQQDFFS